MSRKKILALTLDIGIGLLGAVCAMLTYDYVQSAVWRWALWAAVALSVGGVLVWELGGRRKEKREQAREPRVPSLLALIGEQERELRSWPLVGKVGLLVGKSEGEVLADIDLSACSWNEAIDAAHLAVNYAEGCWWAQDLSSRNGSALIRDEKEIMLTPGWPVQIACGDILLLAGNVRLIVQ